MANRNHQASYASAWYYTKGDFLGVSFAAKIFAIGDIDFGPNVARGAKIGDSILANGRLDSNGAPTLTGVLEITDGVTPITLIDLSAAAAAVAAGSVTRGNTVAGINFTVPGDGYKLQFRCTANPATGASGILKFGIHVTGLCYGDEDPTRAIGTFG